MDLTDYPFRVVTKEVPIPRGGGRKSKILGAQSPMQAAGMREVARAGWALKFGAGRRCSLLWLWGGFVLFLPTVIRAGATTAPQRVTEPWGHLQPLSFLPEPTRAGQVRGIGGFVSQEGKVERGQTSGGTVASKPPFPKASPGVFTHLPPAELHSK